MPPKPPKNNVLIAVFVARKHAIVKHWKHASQTNTLCEEHIIVEAHPTGISRECLVCQRVKAQHDAARRAELDQLCPQK